MRLQARLAQSAVEYSILLSIVAAAVIGMQTYTRRAVQAKVKSQVDYWLTTAIDPANLPEECKNAGYTIPKVCAQFLGTQVVKPEDTRQFSQVTRSNGGQKRTYSYSSAGKITTISRKKDGTSVRRTGSGLVVTLNLTPPQFVRRPSLPDGLPQKPFPITGIGLGDPGPTHDPTGSTPGDGVGNGSLPQDPTQGLPGTKSNKMTTRRSRL